MLWNYDNFVKKKPKNIYLTKIKGKKAIKKTIKSYFSIFIRYAK
jgi:hypothetical protein